MMNSKMIWMMTMMRNQGYSSHAVRATLRPAGGGITPPPAAMIGFAEESSPRWAVIAPEESIAVVAHISVTHGPITEEHAHGATLRRGEFVLVINGADTWTGVVRRVSSCGALVEECLS
jgi:hypothetical protein